MNRKLFSILWVLTIFAATLPTASAEPFTAEEQVSGYVTVTDENGTIVFQTGLAVHPGDEFISEDNKSYEIVAVEGTLARARYTGSESLSGLLSDSLPVQAANGSAPPPIISIYHTHTDESYIPTDGKATQPAKGSIMKVGDSLGQRLSELGYQIDHSTNIHDPHDANAYQRSRRTFVQLMEKQPAALFDVHRDSAPLSVYKATINGKDAAKMLLVVGRQNQNRATTMNYAKTIKAVADSKYRGLIRGIFIAHGNYNQDLNPRAMLIEVGTQYNTLEAAEYSATLFADIVPGVLSATAGNVAQASPFPGAGLVSAATPATGWGQDMLWIVGLLVVGSVAFLFLSTGSISEAKQKLNNFTSREFGDIFRSRRKRRD